MTTTLEPGLCRLDALHCYDRDDCVVFFPLHQYDHKNLPWGMIHLKIFLQSMGLWGFIFQEPLVQVVPTSLE